MPPPLGGGNARGSGSGASFPSSSSSSSAAAALGRATALRAVARGRHFLRRRPALAKAAATAVGFAGGDVLTQRLNRRLPDGGERAYDLAKTAAMLAVGAALAGPAGLALCRLCDAAAAPSAVAGAGLATGKFVADQLVGCAIWQAAYCAICPWYRDIVVGAARHVAGAVGGAVRPPTSQRRAVNGAAPAPAAAVVV
jgi:hypothetical protein